MPLDRTDKHSVQRNTLWGLPSSLVEGRLESGALFMARR